MGPYRGYFGLIGFSDTSPVREKHIHVKKIGEWDGNWGSGRVTYYHSRLLVQLWYRSLASRLQDDIGIYLRAYSTCRLLAGSTIILATLCRLL